MAAKTQPTPPMLKIEGALSKIVVINGITYPAGRTFTALVARNGLCSVRVGTQEACTSFQYLLTTSLAPRRLQRAFDKHFAQ